MGMSAALLPSFPSRSPRNVVTPTCHIHTSYIHPPITTTSCLSFSRTFAYPKTSISLLSTADKLSHLSFLSLSISMLTN
jgi:hypothetical protein